MDLFEEAFDSIPEGNEPLIISISGGRTSAMMAKFCQTRLNRPLIYVFANTGMEHEDTLRFLHDVEVNFNMPIVWLEGRFHEHGKGVTHEVVSYETAARVEDWQDESKPHPYRDMCAKLGVPSNPAPFCTREMKLYTINHYLKSIGWEKEERAIGIRTDENRRVAKNATKDRIVYPLLDWFPRDKDDVLAFWEDYDWDLAIPEHLGNCVTCFKKSDKKLWSALHDEPEAFAFNDSMEQRYGRQHYRFRVKNMPGTGKFFRGDRSTGELIASVGGLSEEAARRLSEKSSGGCSESCEIYPTVYSDEEQS